MKKVKETNFIINADEDELSYSQIYKDFIDGEDGDEVSDM